MSSIRQTLMLSAVYCHTAAALAIHERTFHTSTQCLTSTKTTTIPWTGTTTTCTTITPCSGPVTVIVETPMGQARPPPPTATPTLSPGGPCPIKPQCAATGFSIDYYTNPFGGYGKSLPSSYYVIKGLSPIRSSLTNVTFFPQDYGPNPPNLPKVQPDPALPGQYYFVGWTRQTNGGLVIDANNFTLVYSGFYRAPATGTYQLCASADNNNDLFFGHGNAFSCLDGKTPVDAPPLVKASGGNFVNDVKCASVDMIGGQFYPVRNVMGNFGGPSAFSFTIREPGVGFETRRNAFAGEVYPRDCWLFL